MFSLPHEFPNEWHRIFNPEPDAGNQILHMGNLKERFPFFAQSQQIDSVKLIEVRLFTPTDGLHIFLLQSAQAEPLAEIPGADCSEGALTGNLLQYVITDLSEELTGFWGIRFNKVNQDGPITKEQLKDAWLVVKYEMD